MIIARDSEGRAVATNVFKHKTSRTNGYASNATGTVALGNPSAARSEAHPASTMFAAISSVALEHGGSL